MEIEARGWLAWNVPTALSLTTAIFLYNYAPQAAAWVLIFVPFYLNTVDSVPSKNRLKIPLIP